MALLCRLEPAPFGGRAGSLRGGKSPAVRLPRGLGRDGPAAKVAVGKAVTAGVAEGLALGMAVLAGMLCLYFFWLKPDGYLAAAAARLRTRRRCWAWTARTGSSSGALAIFDPLAAGRVLLAVVPLRRAAAIHAGGAAVVLSSLAFTAHHVILLSIYFGASWATILFSLCVAVGGAAWAWIYHRSGSLLGPWLSHLLIDAGIFVVGYDLVWR